MVETSLELTPERSGLLAQPQNVLMFWGLLHTQRIPHVKTDLYLCIRISSQNIENMTIPKTVTLVVITYLILYLSSHFQRKSCPFQFLILYFEFIPECFDYVNNTSNDPFDWMEDGSAVKDGEEVSVVCNAGYVQILGLTVRQFCELATGTVSVCMRKQMYLSFAGHLDQLYPVLLGVNLYHKSPKDACQANICVFVLLLMLFTCI